MTEIGQVGLTKASDGNYHVLRAESVERNSIPWDEEAAITAKNALAHAREEKALEKLEKKLRREAEIHINDEILKRLPPPAEW